MYDVKKYKRKNLLIVSFTKFLSYLNSEFGWCIISCELIILKQKLTFTLTIPVNKSLEYLSQISQTNNL